MAFDREAEGRGAKCNPQWQHSPRRYATNVPWTYSGISGANAGEAQGTPIGAVPLTPIIAATTRPLSFWRDDANAYHDEFVGVVGVGLVTAHQSVAVVPAAIAPGVGPSTIECMSIFPVIAEIAVGRDRADNAYWFMSLDRSWLEKAQRPGPRMGAVYGRPGSNCRWIKVGATSAALLFRRSGHKLFWMGM